MANFSASFEVGVCQQGVASGDGERLTIGQKPKCIERRRLAAKLSTVADERKRSDSKSNLMRR